MERHKDSETVGPMPRTVFILDFGAQYSQLIARRVREHGVYCEILPHDTPWSAIAQREPAAMILSGGPASTLAPDAPDMDPQIVRSGLPMLGDLLRHAAGGEGARRRTGDARPRRVRAGDAARSPKRSRRSSRASLRESRVWMSHGDTVTKLPPGFDVLAPTARCRIAAMGSARTKSTAMQFHPEVVHTRIRHGRC